MSPEDFCRWLQGFSELANTKAISPQQWESIKDHLNLVYYKVTANRVFQPMSIPTPKEFDRNTIVC